MDALEDKVTVPILYQPRLPELHLNNEMDTDELLAECFKDFGEEEEQVLREKIKRLKFTPTQVAQVRKRMQKIAEDIVEHFLREIEPRGFKAMVVAHRRKMAVEYKELVDKILKSKGRSDIKTDVVITVQQDEEWARPYQRTPAQEKLLTNQSFPDPNNPLKILFVSDKLLTGFDAPILQVMYFDKRLKEHTLLQAIARVNRPFKLKRTINGREWEVEKNFGLIVDYFGIASELEDALAKYESEEIKGIYKTHEDLLERIEEVKKSITQIFSVDLTKEEWKNEDVERCVNDLNDKEKRKQFALLKKEFDKLLDQLLPDPNSLNYVTIFNKLKKIHQRALNRFSDSTLKLKEYLPKLMEQVIEVSEITILEPVNVTDKEFLNRLEEYESTEEGKAEMLINALNTYISEHIHEDPYFYQSLNEQLEKIINEFQERRKEAKEFVSELLKLREQILQQENEAEKLGLAKKQLPFFHFLRSQGLGEEKAKEMVADLELEISKNWQRDWWMMESSRKKMKVAIYRVLKKHGIEREKAENWQNELLGIAEQHYKILN
jgi:type I restriction enzyme R subunit